MKLAVRRGTAVLLMLAMGVLLWLSADVEAHQRLHRHEPTGHCVHAGGGCAHGDHGDPEPDTDSSEACVIALFQHGGVDWSPNLLTGLQRPSEQVARRLHCRGPMLPSSLRTGSRFSRGPPA